MVMDNMNSVITKYQNGLGIDNKLKLKTGGVSKYFLQDHLGSTTALTNSSGNVVESASYDSFGNSTNNLSTRYQFTGREFDSDIGLQYSRARWYDATLGRFISEDPIGLNGGINQFGYVGNNSSNLVDPSGLDGCRRLPNGNCVAEPQTPTGAGEPMGRRSRAYIDPTSSPTPSPTPYSPPTPPSTNGGTECECSDSPYQNSFPGTFQIGLGGNGTLGPFPVTGSVGLAIDTSGNVGFYYEGGTGAGLGAEANGGVQLAVTNASNINNLSGIFVNPGGGLGAGVAGSGNLMFGTSPSGPIVGGGVILGGGAGAGGSVTVTNTGIVPLFNIPKLFGGKNCAR
jgi:RHS repeat-associated protein